MLKLEKGSGLQKISIRLRNQDRVFNRPFFKALAIACFLHAMGLGCFHIQTFIRGPEKRNAPALVTVDISNAILAHADREVRYRHPLEPRESVPRLPLIPRPILFRNGTAAYQKNLQMSNPFSQIEQRLAMPESGEKLSNEKIEIAFHISGKLADHQITSRTIGEKTLEAIKNVSAGQYSVRYTTQVDGRSGKIIWYDMLQSTTSEDLDPIAEQILKEMEFQRQSDLFIVSGEVEIKIFIE